MKKLIVILCFLALNTTFAQTSESDDIKAIHKVLKKQRIAWSENDIEKYMEGYWKSDSLAFYGNKGVTYGWENTLDHYLTYYPTAAYTGKLSFKINAITKISTDSYYVLGEFHIKRDIGNADGIFMLVFKKINGQWKIIADTSV
ncbi:nuclear transport factor 2 family protein [Algibacter sp. 2305UL17-15]|uniref:YybH family protein n=1 Tax=Algibacter sp. 2305UL17-15 TaxID=3231268 RepID=UPI003458B0B8